MSVERRQFVRVSVDCVVTFRKVIDLDQEKSVVADRFDPISSNEISDIASKVRASGEQRDEMLLELLLWIDWKVNYLIKNLVKNKNAVAFPYDAEMVDLSASGMKFVSREQVSLGDKIETRFFLPVLPFNEMLIEGLVSRVRQRTSDADLLPRFEIGVEFANLRSSDQEILFSYVMKRERQLRQAQREHDSQGYIPRNL